MRKLFTFLLAMVASITLMAQVTTSNISGKITDNDKQPLPGATVIATHVPSGSQYYAVADMYGIYRLLNIRPGGPYKMEFRMVGFQMVTINGVTTTLGETKVINTHMKEEAIGLNEIIITADAITDGTLDTDHAGAVTSISTEQIQNMPTLTRNLNDILALTPQAATHGNNLSIGGGNYRQSYVTVDGAAFNNAFGIGSNLPGNGSPISLDALETMTVSITPYDVRQSGFTGGAINAVTKSGSNEWHTSLYNYFQNNALKGYWVGDQELTNTYSLNNTTGFTVGGPIVKDKLFFFVNAEYAVDDLPGSTDVARTKDSQEFGSDVVYNRPLESQMNSIKDFLVSKGYNPGRYQEYSLSTPDYKMLARLDWNINENNSLIVRFSHTHNSYSNAPSNSMNPLGGTNTSYTFGGVQYHFDRYRAGRQSSYTLPFESARYFQEQNFMSAAAELNTRFLADRANNMFRVTWSHQDEPRSFVGDLFPTVDIMSTEGVTGNDNTAMFTTFGVDPFTYGNMRDVQTVIATDEISWVDGMHNMTGGLQFEWNRTKNGFMQGGAGWYLYNSWQDFVDDVTDPTTAAGPALYMITHPNNNTLTQEYPSFDYSQASAYIQDEMSLSEYFKATAGLRLEMPFLTNPNNNFNIDFDSVAQANPNSSFAGLSTADLPKNRFNVSPRLGFSWDVLHDRSMILRGGTGIFTGRIPFVWIVSAMGNANVLQCQYIANDNTGNDVIHFHQSVAEQLNELYHGNFVSKDLAAPTAATILAKDLKMPSAWKSSLGLDAQLPYGFEATLEGVFSYNYNEVYASVLGMKLAGLQQLPGENGLREVWQSENILNGDSARMNGYYLHNETDLHGYYYSLTAQLSKEFKCGLSTMLAYTYSYGKSVSDGDGDQISGFGNTYNKNGSNTPELGISGFLPPHRLIANINYQIPEGKRTSTNIGLFYEGFNAGFVGNYSYTRVSYVMNNVSGTSANQLLYIPTELELMDMPFVDDANKAAFNQFINNDAYLSSHRGQYEERNAILAPWLNRINFHVSQEFYVDIMGKKNTFEIAADVKNIANMLNHEWSTYQELSGNVVLRYANGQYTFTQPTWANHAKLASTWSAALSFRYKF